ncbi:SDR family oxidoreductase [Janthinobacterium agaricidamnosum]|uniref:NAD dependent epimerase/dehydratase family protein n=1 Tax=Janthinobacterium agaricidamnosum NBRC 102515 = DSM 9628 TaxID=1349767 RepID=W0V6M9_9BURK|nr:aldehyde reductase [Janthinobacterium agaricidamnosum]CDG83531.1 NAD dependent epimerase/dehydratase family protein [Janthinobacterium agaricidamnosum NBRC 102515 = DSM 9628]
MSDTVLVTGGSGFVAGWCIAELLKRGYTVRTTLRSLSREAAIRAMLVPVVDAGDKLTFHGADLTSDAGWDAAMAGCDYVLHVASPLGGDGTKDPDELIIPARDGTLRVLRAATRAGVKRVVMTSSTAASCPPQRGPDSFNDETVWSNPDDRNLPPYRKSKILSEMAAWDFMRTHGGATTLTTVLASAVFGPLLSADNLGSVQVIGRLLSGKMPAYPRLGFNVVDVRDLADAHIRAMTAPEAAGQRFIAASDYLWMKDIAGTLRSRLGTQAAKVPTRRMPDFALRLLSLFDPSLKVVTPGLGRKHSFNAAKARRVLGWTPRPAATTVLDCANSLIEKNAV